MYPLFVLLYGQALVERIALYAQAYTLYSSVRPFGVSTILGAVDKNGPQLYIIEPSGVAYVRTHSSTRCGHLLMLLLHRSQGYHGAAIGKGRQLAKTEIEKLKLSEMSTREAVIEAARMYVCSSHLADCSHIVFAHHIASTSYTTMRRRRSSRSRCLGSATSRVGSTSQYPKSCTTRQSRRPRSS